MLKELCEHVDRSIAKAWQHQSRIPPAFHENKGHGRSAPKIRHLLNNLCSLPDTVFLEVGSWMGASFISALIGNEESVTAGYAIDSWRFGKRDEPVEYGENERMFDENTARFLAAYGDRWRKIKQDLFTVESLPLPPTIFYYDADHSRTQPGTEQFFGMLADPCIVCLDDWSWDFVQTGWRKACDGSDWQVVKEWTNMPNKRRKDTDLWWEGFYVCVLARETP